ncbi:hypothetical protein [Nocardia rhizosphaerae]|uniref:TM2 domain-containing protein n=1 Tax=Nocardia rhizosphaerae TaxID=1691571 RepID=A0ABV8L8L2_9NOCA
MTQPYENDTLPAAYPPPTAPETNPPALPDPANFAPPRPVYPQPQFQPMMPVVNVTQNNMSGGGFVNIRRGPNHGLHLVLTILTCGMWAPVWIAVWIIDAIGCR